MTNEELWQAVLARIQLNTSSNNFSAWFVNTNIVSKNEKDVKKLLENYETKPEITCYSM